MTEIDTTDPKNATTCEPVFVGVNVNGYDQPVQLGWSIRTGVPGNRTYHLITRDGVLVATSPKLRFVVKNLAEALAARETGSLVEDPEWEALLLAAQDKLNQENDTFPADEDEDSDDEDEDSDDEDDTTDSEWGN
jgi:hypothetical protein